MLLSTSPGQVGLVTKVFDAGLIQLDEFGETAAIDLTLFLAMAALLIFQEQRIIRDEGFSRFDRWDVDWANVGFVDVYKELSWKHSVLDSLCESLLARGPRLDRLWSTLRYLLSDPEFVKGSIDCCAIVDRMVAIRECRRADPATGSTPGVVCELLVRLAGVKRGQTVADVSCRSGELLFAAARSASEVKLSGWGGTVVEAQIAATRAFLGRHVNPTIVCGNVLTDESLTRAKEADVVISNPPFSQSVDKVELANWRVREVLSRWGDLHGNNADFLYLAAALSMLKSGGKAVFLMPASAAERLGEREIRCSMSAKGLVKAVIALPPKIFVGTDIAPIVVVCEQGGGHKSIRMVDAVNVTNGKRHQFSADAVEQILAAVEGSADGVIAQDVPITKLGANGYSWAPRHYLMPTKTTKDIALLASAVDRDEARLAELRDRYRELNNSLGARHESSK